MREVLGRAPVPGQGRPARNRVHSARRRVIGVKRLRATAHLPGLLALRDSRGKSDRVAFRIDHLGRLLVLRGHQQDSTEMPEEIGSSDAEFLLREIPRQLRERWREHQRRDAALSVVGVQPAALDAMRDEVVRIASTPRGLCRRPPRDLTRRCRTRTLATADAAIRHKPPTADAAGPLREHPEMLGSSAENQRGPL